MLAVTSCLRRKAFALRLVVPSPSLHFLHVAFLLTAGSRGSCRTDSLHLTATSSPSGGVTRLLELAALCRAFNFLVFSRRRDVTSSSTSPASMLVFSPFFGLSGCQAVCGRPCPLCEPLKLPTRVELGRTDARGRPQTARRTGIHFRRPVRATIDRKAEAALVL